MIPTAGPAAASFFSCLLAIIALRPIAIAIDLIDRPGGRKTHHGDVPVVGGLAMFIAVVLGTGLLPLSSSATGSFLAACALLVIVGMLDDRFDLSPWTRLPAQIAAAIVLMLGTGSVVTTLGDPFATGDITFGGWQSYVVTIVLVIAAINAFNMLDGMDGLAGTTSVIALAALGFLAWSGGLTFAAMFSLIIAGAVCAFLVFNLPIRINGKLRCFMGDAGSTLLGFTLAWLCIEVSQGPIKAASPVTTLWVVALPLYELVWTTARRAIRGVSPFRADDNHFHHLLLKAGFGVRGALVVFVVLASLLAAFGLFADLIGIPDYISFALLVLTGVGVVRLMYRADLIWKLVPKSRQLPYRRHVDTLDVARAD